MNADDAYPDNADVCALRDDAGVDAHVARCHPTRLHVHAGDAGHAYVHVHAAGLRAHVRAHGFRSGAARCPPTSKMQPAKRCHRAARSETAKDIAVPTKGADEK